MLLGFCDSFEQDVQFIETIFLRIIYHASYFLFTKVLAIFGMWKFSVFTAYTAVASFAWVPWFPGNPSILDQWVPEPINFGKLRINLTPFSVQSKQEIGV